MDKDTAKSWRDYALKERIERVAIAPSPKTLLENTAIECWGSKHPEQAGFVCGLVEGNTFYILHGNYLASSHNAEVRIPRRLHPTDEQETLEVGAEFPNFRTVVYHSHPKITEEDFKKLFPGHEHTLELFKREIESGVYNWLVSGRGKPSLDRVLTENLTRGLSEEDIAVTPGNYHLLITHTARKADPRAYINFWEINDRRRSEGLVRVERMKPPEIKHFAQTERRMEEIRREVNKRLYGYNGLETDEEWDAIYHEVAPRIFAIQDEKARFYQIQEGESYQNPGESPSLGLSIAQNL
ncbi:MAG: hypothetical protein NT076_05935 [Candidatus Pacearchaeota archaeon]|nr:hypothetical protein [Candidatus Pacearchaeota archaeon]